MLSDYLKEHSRKDHDSIEGSIDLVKCAADPEKYLKVLKAFYGYYLPVEKIFDEYAADFMAMGINLEERHKLKLLTDDLQHLGLSEKEITLLKVCDQLPAMNNVNEAIGVLYVLEGSTMGGQIIFKTLGKAGILNNGDERGRFFKAYGPQTMEKWLEFKKSLNTVPQTENELVLKKAKETFNTLEKWLAVSMQ